MGGTLAILGLLTPVAAAMLVAQSVTIVTLVRGRGFWVDAMGVEYPLLLGAVAVAVGLAGPGAISLDALLRVQPGLAVSVLLLAAGAAGAVVGLLTRRAPGTGDASVSRPR